jgi:hypothetical protein
MVWSTFNTTDTKIAARSIDGQYSDTILCTNPLRAGRSMRPVPKDEDSAMCTEPTTAPTLRGWLRDPMIRLMMESDGVTEHEMITLVRRVTMAVASRPDPVPTLPQWRVQESHPAW